MARRGGRGRSNSPPSNPPPQYGSWNNGNNRNNQASHPGQPHGGSNGNFQPNMGAPVQRNQPRPRDPCLNCGLTNHRTENCRNAGNPGAALGQGPGQGQGQGNSGGSAVYSRQERRKPNPAGAASRWCSTCKTSSHDTAQCFKSGSSGGGCGGDSGSGLDPSIGSRFHHITGRVCPLCLRAPNHPLAHCLHRLWPLAVKAILFAWHRSGRACGFHCGGADGPVWHPDPACCPAFSLQDPGLKTMVGAALWRQLDDNQRRLAEEAAAPGLFRGYAGERDWSAAMDELFETPREAPRETGGDVRMVDRDDWPVKFCLNCRLLDHWQGRECPFWCPMDWAPDPGCGEHVAVLGGLNTDANCWQGRFQNVG